MSNEHRTAPEAEYHLTLKQIMMSDRFRAVERSVAHEIAKSVDRHTLLDLSRP